MSSRSGPATPSQAGDKPARQRFIASSIWFTLPGTPALIALATTLLPPLGGMEEPASRVLLALRWLPVAALPYAAVCLVIATVRFFEGAHNPLLGGESEALRIHGRVMQNTLEQLAWFTLCLLPVAAALAPAQARLLPVLCVAFALVRLLYWWGYLRSGTLGRAPWVQCTFAINVPLLVAACWGLVRPWLD